MRKLLATAVLTMVFAAPAFASIFHHHPHHNYTARPYHHPHFHKNRRGHSQHPHYKHPKQHHHHHS